MDVSGNQTGDVGNVEHQICSHLVGYFPEAFGVDLPGIGAGAADNHLRFVLFRKSLHLVEIYGFRIFRDTVMDDIVKLTREIDWAPVCEMTPVGQVHGQDGISRLQAGEVNGHVGL